MKNTKLATLIAFAVTLLFLGSFYFLYFEQHKSFTCESDTTYIFETETHEKESSFISNMKFSFEDDGKGVNIITGRVQFGQQTYTVNRKVAFDYVRNKNNSYVLNTTSVYLKKDDNLPKDLGERYLYRFSLGTHESTYLVILNLKNGKRLFSSGTLPYFLCR